MILSILTYGDPCLTTPAEDVKEIDDEIRQLVDDMVETMHAAPGIGLAANQVGLLKKVAVVDLSVGESPEELIVLVNPEILESEGEEIAEEGCLSFPEINFNVKRALKIKVKSLNLDGEEVIHDYESVLARAVQHEIDHLNGVLFTKHLHGLAREMIMTKIKRMRRNGEWEPFVKPEFSAK